jgi:hypothetical protein
LDFFLANQIHSTFLFSTYFMCILVFSSSLRPDTHSSTLLSVTRPEIYGYFSHLSWVTVHKFILHISHSRTNLRPCYVCYVCFACISLSPFYLHQFYSYVPDMILLSFAFRVLLPFLCSFYLLCVFVIRHFDYILSKASYSSSQDIYLGKTVRLQALQSRRSATRCLSLSQPQVLLLSMCHLHLYTLKLFVSTDE